MVETERCGSEMARPRPGTGGRSAAVRPGRERLRKLSAVGFVTAVAAAHLVLVGNFLRPADLLGPEPFYRVDYPAIYAYGLGARAFVPHGRVVGYDPGLLAGLATYGWPSANWLPVLMWALPVDPAVTFKLLVVLTFVAAPALPPVGVRLAGGDGRQAAVAFALAVAAWQLDHYAYLFRWYGGFAFLFACYLAPAVLGAGVWLVRGGGTGRALVVGGLAGLLLSWHGTTFAVVAAAAAVAGSSLLVRGRRGRGAAPGGGGARAGAALRNPGWGAPFLRLRSYLGQSYLYGPSAYLFGQSGGWATLRSLFLEPGCGVVAALGAAAPAGLIRLWRRGRREAAVAFGAALAVALAVSCWGSALGLGALEPARLRIALGVLAIAPAAASVTALWEPARRDRRPALVAVTAAVAVVAVAYAATPGYRPTERDLLIGSLATEPPAEFVQLADWLRRHTDASARVAIEDGWPGTDTYRFSFHFPALLQQRTGRAFLNGPYSYYRSRHRRVQFAAGRLAGRELVALDDAELDEILARYNVGWLIPTVPASEARVARARCCRLVVRVGGMGIYRVLREPSWLLAGRADGVDAGPDWIRVRGARPGILVLKLHWFEGLRSRSAVGLGRQQVPGDPIGFVRIDAPQGGDIDIVNAWGPLGLVWGP